MTRMIDLSVVMPSYTEADNLRLLLPQIGSTLRQLNLTYEILVIDTVVAMDDTETVCVENDAKYVPRFPDNTYGSAVRTGIVTAQGKKIVFMDADGSHSPEFLADLYSESNRADIVIASRYIKYGGTENPWYLTAMSRLLNVTFSYVLSLPCKDVSNSYKIYDEKCIKGLRLVCDNFDVVEELIYKAYNNNKNISILEVPYNFKKRIHGETKRNLVVFIVTYFYTMIKLRFFT
jgi:dolichol-phosphate mannosyltransferase